jgi:hypothetical protein
VPWHADRNNTCKYVPVSPPNDIYVADIEDFTVRELAPFAEQWRAGDDVAVR